MLTRYLILIILSFSTVFPSAYAGAIDEAITAYNSGNYLTARRIFKQVVLEGDPVSQRYLAEMYDKGQGGPKDYSKAVELYKKAAKQGDARAQYLLGVKYVNGHGLHENKKLAYAWFAIAFNSGYEKAADPLKVLNLTMPSMDRQEALQLATKKLTDLP